jgi:3-oxoacyl-[acyl-carrier protein] reductase
MRAAFLVTKAVVPGMAARGYGRIVYLGTVLSRQPRENMIALGTSKAALSGFARYVAQEMGHLGVTVNVVAPGPVAETTVLDAILDEEQRQSEAAQTAVGRIARPDDVARAVAFYAGDDSGFITGTTAPVNGGLVMD